LSDEAAAWRIAAKAFEVLAQSGEAQTDSFESLGCSPDRPGVTEPEERAAAVREARPHRELYT